MGMGFPVGSPELTIMWLITLVFYLLPFVIATVAILVLDRAG
jgi:hypothetical protein